MTAQCFCQASANNQDAILQVIRKQFAQQTQILEIGSGTGQHAVFFAANLPHLTWHTSDVMENHASIIAWQAECDATNVRPPVTFRIGVDVWPDGNFDGVFSANTSHIMQAEEVQLMMQLVASQLPEGGVFCLYGPFTQDGKHKGESNLRFDNHLQQQGYGGYRDVAELTAWAGKRLMLEEIVDMPANNHILVWKKI